MNREAGRPGDILSFPESAHSMETGTEEPKPSQVSPAAPGAPTMKYPIKTPEERPVRHDGGKYGYTCSSLTTQIFRFGGCSWPIHRSRRPEPNRAAALGWFGSFWRGGKRDLGKEIWGGCQVIRHQMTGSGLHTLSFRGPEAKSRYLPTLHRLLQAVKSTYRTVRGCEEMTYISSQPLFYAAIFVNDSKRPVLIVISSGAACRYQEKWFWALWRFWVERSPITMGPPHYGLRFLHPAALSWKWKENGESSCVNSLPVNEGWDICCRIV